MKKLQPYRDVITGTIIPLFGEIALAMNYQSSKIFIEDTEADWISAILAWDCKEEIDLHGWKKVEVTTFVGSVFYEKNTFDMNSHRNAVLVLAIGGERHGEVYKGYTTREVANQAAKRKAEFKAKPILFGNMLEVRFYVGGAIRVLPHRHIRNVLTAKAYNEPVTLTSLNSTIAKALFSKQFHHNIPIVGEFSDHKFREATP